VKSTITSEQSPVFAGLWKMHLVILSIGLVLVGIVGYGFYSGYRINTVDAALLRAVMKIRLEASTTNLVIEGLLGEGLAADFEPVLHPLDVAVEDFRSIVHQSKHQIPLLPFHPDPISSTDMAELDARLSVFKEKAGERYTNKRRSFLDEEADRIYRQAFRDLTGELESLESRLRSTMSRNLVLFGYTQTAMIGLCILLTIAAGIVFHRFAGQRAKAYDSLQAANERLEKEIAERRRSEERLSHLVDELKDFSYAVSHDLRAPLINLKGFSREFKSAFDVIRPVIDDATAELDEKRKQTVTSAFYEDLAESIGFIDTSVLKMERLINGILKLSRAGRRELILEKLDMNRIVSDTLKSLAYQVKSRNIRMITGDLPPTVADKVCMEQVFSNLLSNAINYLDPERTGEIEISGESRSDENVFHIRDNGSGIKKDDIPRIFNLFERLNRNPVEGEGMGLAYVRALVRRHGGIVRCESEYGVGSTFTFTVSKGLG